MAAKIINVSYKVDSKELAVTKKQIQDLEKETKKSELQMQKLGDAAKYGAQKASNSFLSFKNILGAITFAGIIAGLTSLGKKILDLGIKQEMLNVAFTTFLGSAEKAKRVVADLTKFAIITPFTPDQVNNAAKSLLAFGVQAEDIIPTLKFLGDVSSGTGKDLSEMAVIFGQIRSTGRLMGQDLLQLINAGFNPLQIISQKTGKEVLQLKSDMEKGLITFDMVEQAFKDATSAGGLFFNLMEKQSATVGGKLSTLAGNIEEIEKQAFAASRGGLSAFLDVLLDISEALATTDEQILESQGVNQDLIAMVFGIANKDIIIKQKDELRKLFNDVTSLYKQAIKDIGKEGKDGVHLQWMAEQIKSAAELRDITLTEAQAQTMAIRVYREAIKVNNETVESKNKVTLAAILGREEQNKAILAEIEEEKRLRDLKTAQDKLKKSIEERKKALEALRSVGRRLGKDIEDGRKEAGERESKRQSDAISRELEQDARRAELKIQNEQDTEDEITRIREEAAERRMRIQQQVQDFAIDSLQQILYAALLTNEEDFTAQREKFDREIELAGDNERAKDQIRLRQENEERAFRRRQKVEEQQAALKKIAIDTAINVIRSIANNGGIPLGLPFGALAAAAGVVQATVVRKLAKGEVNINGPGTKTSDSIPALISRGESVINADATSKSSRLLEAINDRKIDDRILGNAARGGSQAVGIDYERLGQEFRKGKVDYDTHGYTIMKGIQKGKNFKMFIRSKVQGY